MIVKRWLAEKAGYKDAREYSASTWRTYFTGHLFLA
jgi:hypothetical protein